MRADHTTRPYISAKYLLADPPPAVTVIPEGFARYIQYLPAKPARGISRGAKGGAMVGSTSPRAVGMARMVRR